MAAPYTHKKLTDIDDSAASFGIGEIQEARFATNDLETEDTGFSHHRLKADKRQGFAHKHEDAEEVYVVMAGSGASSSTTRSSASSASMRSVSTPGVIRCFEAGPDGLELLAFGPRRDGDGEVVNGWWTD